jgi:hypothetical protein
MADVSADRSSGRLPDAPAVPPLEPAMIPRRLWLVALVVGAVAWVAGAVATAVTGDTSKGLVVLAVATLVRPRVPRDGMVLGATVGAAFAASRARAMRSAC